MMMSLLERLNHEFSGGIMFVQPIAAIMLLMQIEPSALKRYFRSLMIIYLARN